MICDPCKAAADSPEVNILGHVACYNRARIISKDVYESRNPDEQLSGCFCQHHPVGTRQIKKEAK